VKKNLTSLPGWPRWLTRELTAAYLGVSPGTLDKLSKLSDFPRPHALAGDSGLLRYDRHELDEWSDRKRDASDRSISNSPINTADSWGEPQL
jgi:predicted DNA-binding transcriptional regulator AlpA